MNDDVDRFDTRKSEVFQNSFSLDDLGVYNGLILSYSFQGRLATRRHIKLGQNMSENSVATTKAPTARSEATKDTGRVQIGGACMHFGDATPSREATKDSGRVRIGGACLQF